MQNELKTSVLNHFWYIYEIEGALPALNWLETLKYHEEYCSGYNVDDIANALLGINLF